MYFGPLRSDWLESGLDGKVVEVSVAGANASLTAGVLHFEPSVWEFKNVGVGRKARMELRRSDLEGFGMAVWLTLEGILP